MSSGQVGAMNVLKELVDLKKARRMRQAKLPFLEKVKILDTLQVATIAFRKIRKIDRCDPKIVSDGSPV